ncbi:MAG: DUF5317 domain-containing protein [Clostridiales bacterium]|nr:DUF5317 domain-containing protein [Clostridiales bacterium]MDR2713616.1 DUF5317 domain-containing protein [Clostridiales bacterium]
MFYEGLVLIIIMAVLAVLSLFRLLPRNLKSLWLFIPLSLLTAVFLFLCRLSPPFASTYRFYFQLLIFGAGLFFFISNWRLPGMVVCALGTLANGLVICTNGGVMPVLPGVASPALAPKLSSGELIHHATATGQTYLSYLADRFRIPGLESMLFSWGDILLLLGMIWLILALIFGNRQTVSKIENVRNWKI